MKIYVLITDEFVHPEVLLVTANLDKAKQFVSEQELRVIVWENEKEIYWCSFEDFKEKY